MLEMLEMTDTLRLWLNILAVDTMRKRFCDCFLLVGSCFSISAGAEAVKTSISGFSSSGDWASPSFPCERETEGHTTIIILPISYLTQKTVSQL
jgi:hypothetical protein